MRIVCAVFLSLLVCCGATWAAPPDVSPTHVMLDVRLVSVSEHGANVLVSSERPLLFTESVDRPPAGTPGWDHVPYFRTFPTSVTLSLLVSHGDASVTLLPRIMTRVGERAAVRVGDRVHLAYFDRQTEQLQIEFFDVDAHLAVRPDVLSDGFVSLDIEHGVSTLIGGPRTSIRKGNNLVRVRDGDTILLVGLLDDLESAAPQTRQLLAGLPVLGELFRTPLLGSSRNRLFVTITPRIMP